MPTRRKHDLEGLLVFATMLEGCGYYGCKDDLKRDYVPNGDSYHPQVGSSSWQDAQTLEVSFPAPLRPPTEVDPRRFALLRYNVKIDNGDDYYCHFDLCYRQLGEVEAIPESLDWDPAQPEVLRLHFAEPIPASACEPWRGTGADYQALELIYLGVEQDEYGTDTGDLEAELDQLAFADDQGVEAIGPEQARSWLAGCREGFCEFQDFCIERGGYSDWWGIQDLWVDCP
jgi:hypothetical protein